VNHGDDGHPLAQPPASNVSRRSFLQAGAGAVALSAASYRRVLGANDRIGVGFIGYGLIGKRHVVDFQVQEDVTSVGLSDAHRGRLEEGRAQLGPAAKAYADFRELLDDKDIDAVVISTPDHWHALMTILACAAGKDAYVEKPLSLFVREGQWMQQVAERHRRVVQVGTQQRSGPHYQRARDLIREGHIGTVMSVRMQAYRNVMPGFGSPADGEPPAELDWNRMLGPAPIRPYNRNRGIYHFRWFWDYSGGQMTNLGHHALDIMHWTLGGMPVAVTSAGGRMCLTDNGETPDTQDALFEFSTTAGGNAAPAETGKRTQWTASWSHREASGSGGARVFPTEFYGTHGMLAISRRAFFVRSDKKLPPESHVPQFTDSQPVGGVARTKLENEEWWTTPIEDRLGSEERQFARHVRNFLDCVKSRETPVSDLASSHRVSTMCHLANLSLRLGRKLRWDDERQDILDDAEASSLLVRPYRAPWDSELRALLG
jgi:predicted dehydrogenase